MSRAVTFRSGDSECAGVLFEGRGGAFAGPDGRLPCVVLAHGFSGTVDAGLVPYAERFAEAGLHALAFDYRHFGASPGEPRQLLDVGRQLEDYASAVRFARETDGVDPDRIVVWGTSYSGGHVVEVAAADDRIAAVVAQTPAMDGAPTVLNILRYAGPGTLARLIRAGMRDQVSGPYRIPAVGPPGTLGVMTTPDAEPGFRAIAGPSWRNEVCARITLRAGLYRPGLKADRLPCPILVQLADDDAVVPTRPAQDAAWRATGRAEVRTYPIGHFDIYVGHWFEKAVADQLHFLRRHLGGRGERRSEHRQPETRAVRAAAAE